MNSYYGPQNSHYGQPNTYYAPAPQPQYAPQPMYAPAPVAPQNSGSGMKMAAGALALLAIGIGAFALVLGMKNSETTTTAQSTPSTVFNIPSEINIPSLVDDDSPSTSPVVVNNPAPRVITIPGQAPVQQAPAQQAPVQQAPVQIPANGNDQAKADAQAAADAQAKADAQKKADEEAAAKKKAEDDAGRNKGGKCKARPQTSGPRPPACVQQAEQIRVNARRCSSRATAGSRPGDGRGPGARGQAAAMEAQAAALGG